MCAGVLVCLCVCVSVCHVGYVMLCVLGVFPVCNTQDAAREHKNSLKHTNNVATSASATPKGQRLMQRTEVGVAGRTVSSPPTQH